MARRRSPLLGYNHNVRHLGRAFHVQTEDSGIDHPRLFTHMFHGGVIVATRKLEYDPDAADDIVKGLMQAQHKALLKDLVHGVLDPRIDELLGPPPQRPARAIVEPAPTGDLSVPVAIPEEISVTHSLPEAVLAAAEVAAIDVGWDAPAAAAAMLVVDELAEATPPPGELPREGVPLGEISPAATQSEPIELVSHLEAALASMEMDPALAPTALAPSPALPPELSLEDELPLTEEALEAALEAALAEEPEATRIAPLPEPWPAPSVSAQPPPVPEPAPRQPASAPVPEPSPWQPASAPEPAPRQSASAPVPVSASHRATAPVPMPVPQHPSGTVPLPALQPLAPAHPPAPLQPPSAMPSPSALPPSPPPSPSRPQRPATPPPLPPPAPTQPRVSPPPGSIPLDPRAWPIAPSWPGARVAAGDLAAGAPTPSKPAVTQPLTAAPMVGARKPLSPPLVRPPRVEPAGPVRLPVPSEAPGGESSATRRAGGIPAASAGPTLVDLPASSMAMAAGQAAAQQRGTEGGTFDESATDRDLSGVFRALRNTGDDEDVARIHSPAPPQPPELPRRPPASAPPEPRTTAAALADAAALGRPSTSWVRRGGQVESPLDRTGAQRTIEIAPRTVHDLPTAPVKRPPAATPSPAPVAESQRRPIATLPHAIVEVQRSGLRTTVPGGGSSYASGVRAPARAIGGSDTQRGATPAIPSPPRPPPARPEPPRAEAPRTEAPRAEPPRAERPPPLSGVVVEQVRRGTDVTSKTPVVPPASGAITPGPPSHPRTPSSGVVVSRPAVIIGATPTLQRTTTGERQRPVPAGPARPQGPRAREVRRERTTQETAFGQDLISEKSLDEVILAYLSEDAPED